MISASFTAPPVLALFTAPVCTGIWNVGIFFFLYLAANRAEKTAAIATIVGVFSENARPLILVP